MARRIEITPIEDYDRIGKILFNRNFDGSALSPEDVIALDAGADLVPDKSYEYLLIQIDGKDAGIFRYSFITTITVSFHVHLLPSYWGQGIMDECQHEIIKYLKDLKVFKLVSQVPWDCKEVQKAITRMGFEAEGVLTNAVYWNDKVQHLVLFGREI